MQVEKEAREKQSELNLALERVEYLIGQLKGAIPEIEELSKRSDELKTEAVKQLISAMASFKGAKNIKTDLIKDFLEEPYAISMEPVRGRRDTYILHVPRFYDLPLGYLAKQTKGYNYFYVSRIMDFFGEIPFELKQALGWKEAPDLKLERGVLKGPKPALEEARKKYKALIKSEDENGLVINPKYTFQLLASLIQDGVLPFTPQPIRQELFADRPFLIKTQDENGNDVVKTGDRALRPYQLEAWNALKTYSHVGIYYPASTGKTFVALYAMTKLKPPHLVAVPSRLLIDQWNARIESHTDLKPNVEITVVTYQTAIKKYMDRKHTLLVVDECHHAPANDFSKLSLMKRDCTLGLSATPFREDGREPFVIAFHGKPLGLTWDYFRQLNLIKNPVCNVWLVKDFSAKLSKLDSMLRDEQRTIIFCDHIELGKTIAAKHKIPFVYGATKENRIEIFQTHPVVVASRVADEGISLPEIQRVIEVDYLYGSRRQELQRFTRLLHGFSTKSQGEHHILMTVDEYERDKRRLFSVMDRGFKIEIRREGVSERAIKTVKPYRIRPQKRTPATLSPQPQQPAPPPMVGLPGFEKLFQTLKPSQQSLIAFLSQRDGEWISTKKLYPVLGFATYQGMINTLNFPYLEKRNLIERKTGFVRTNLRNLKAM